MQSRRLRITAGGPFEGALFSVERTSSPEAWAAQLPPSANPGPAVEEFSHRAFPWDLAHALPEIFSSLQSWKRPISHSVFRRTNRLSRALAGSRKCGREWGPFAPAPAGLIFSTTSSGARNSPAWKLWISSASRPALASKLRRHPVPPLRAASGPGGSLFGLA
jgi:hypothetical protein